MKKLSHKLTAIKKLLCAGTLLLSLTAQGQWKQVFTPQMGVVDSDFCFSNDSTGLTIGIFGYASYNWVDRTIKYGSPFYQITPKPMSPFILQHIKGDTILYCSSKHTGSIELTFNGGQTWQTFNCCFPKPLQSAYFLSSNYGLTVDSLGIVKRYFNSNTFTVSPFPASSVAKQLFIKNYAQGFAIINDKSLYSTSDSGYTWSVVLTKPFKLNQIFFPGQNVGYIACDSGKVLKTIDGGLSWSLTSTGILDNINSVHFRNDTLGFCGGDVGSVFKTKNGGLNWIKEVIPSVQNLIRVVTTKNKAYAMDDEGKLFRRDIDTCDKVSKPSVSIVSAPSQLCSGHQITSTVTPSNGTYVYPAGSYNQFNNSFGIGASGVHHIGYYFTDSLTGCSNMATKIFTVIPTPTLTLTASSYNLCIDSVVSVVLVGSPPGGSYFPPGTINGNSLTVTFGFPGTYQSVYSYTDSSTGCSNSITSQSIYVTQCTGIQEYGDESEFAIYPNPVNNQLTIKFGNVTLYDNKTIRVFNSLGKQVFETKIESSEFTINMGSYDSGIYLLFLSGKEKTFTRKIIKN